MCVLVLLRTRIDRQVFANVKLVVILIKVEFDNRLAFTSALGPFMAVLKDAMKS